MIEEKLRGKVEHRGADGEKRRRIAAHAVAEMYVSHLLLGHYKYHRDYLDRTKGRPIAMLEIGKGAGEELAAFLTAPGPGTRPPAGLSPQEKRAKAAEETGLHEDLVELRQLAGKLRGKVGKQLQDALDKLVGNPEEAAPRKQAAPGKKKAGKKKGARKAPRKPAKGKPSK